MRFMMATKRAAADHGLAKAAGGFSRNPLLDRKNEGFVNYFCASGCPDSRGQAAMKDARHRHAERAGRAGTGTIGVRGQACG